MINPSHFRLQIIRPVLVAMGMHSEAAENLLLGTALQESRLTFLKQINGPALGVYQIEPDTHDDVWQNYLAYRPDLASIVGGFKSSAWQYDDRKDLIGNLFYATAIARIIYRRVPEPLPAHDDIEALGRYWKQHYNTPLGKGTANEFVANYTP